MAKAEKARARIPHFLREWRLHAGMTQSKLGDRAGGIDKSMMSRLERGEAPYQQDKLEALAEALHITPGELLNRDPRDPYGIWAAATMISVLTDNQREAVLAFLTTLTADKGALSTQGASAGKIVEPESKAPIATTRAVAKRRRR